MNDTEQKQEEIMDAEASAAEATETEASSESETAVEMTEVEALQAQLAEAEAKANENWDQLVRAKAEMDNIRRRSERELTNAHKYALEKFANELLPVIDSLEMGVAAAMDENADVSKLREGTEMTLKLFENAIDKFGIKSVHPKGEAFNPDHHQAMTMIDSPEHQPNTVIDVMQKGYLLNERLVRPAMVVVASGNSGSGAESKEKN